MVLFAVPLGIVLSNHYRDEELLRLQRDTVTATRTIDVPTASGDRVELPRDPECRRSTTGPGGRVAGGGAPRAPTIVRGPCAGAA